MSPAGVMFEGLLYPNLVGLLDNAALMAPKAADLAVQLMSQLAARIPAAVLATLDPQPLGDALLKYLGEVFQLVRSY